MPDKHEVGGSSPLGPTSRTQGRNQHLQKERKRLTRTHVRDKPFGNGFESTWAYQANRWFAMKFLASPKVKFALRQMKFLTLSKVKFSLRESEGDRTNEAGSKCSLKTE